MYIYQVGYDSPEDSNDLEFSHEQKKTKEQLELDVFNTCIEIAKTDSDRFLRNISDVVGGDFNTTVRFIKSFEKLGYKHLQYEQTVVVSGWTEVRASIMNAKCGTLNNLQNWHDEENSFEHKLVTELRNIINTPEYLEKITKEAEEYYNG